MQSLQKLTDNGIALYLDSDCGCYALGPLPSRSLKFEGEVINATFGGRRAYAFEDGSRLSGALEFVFTNERSEILGTTFSNERI